MESLLYKKLKERKVQCKTCNHFCVISDGEKGICGVRENHDGILQVLNFNKTISRSIDPIEKKPLNEYLKGTNTYSFCTIGCNLDCPWCQNHSISQMSKSSHHAIGYDVTAKEHIALAKKYNCPSISYTYTEPTIFLEYALETMKLAKKEGLKNIWVSNGYMSKETLEMILPYLDAANIDYKGNQSVYKSYCNSYNLKVLENIKRMKEYGVHIEVTTLLITGVNDSIDIIKEMAQDLIRYIGKDFIWHISRFFPHYKMMNVEATSISRLHEARSIAHSLGISKIYLGNV